ncbi:hypothetical protein NAL32_06250 [Chryseobacterium sp. Ch-15]|uniref:ATP-binding protein n=1 Tax=Chryseobacterium muglaense TaxID=2893752 RepID=A0A9Q3UXK5_9FLAO|nr:tetratricopeptide repeat-containing sensor histidine kinase [Chryseobacterium muglaense]MBD3904342.1 ATP-binding protein [Chryseobacterium muglaense]MCC9035341.1 hypothetical protein [Chryseobacterium muglaense]MCM2553994.1 hypothetical protein [Chryseobacterium muglaense]
MKLSYLIIILLIFYSCKKEKAEDKIYQSKIFYEKAKKFVNENISDSAFYYFNLAKNDYLNNYDSIGAGKSLVNMAIIQHNNGDYYGSIETSLEANKLLKNENDSIVKSTLASNYNNMAICSSFLKNYNESVDFYKKALQFSNDNKNRYVYNNNIGDAFILLDKYKEAKEYLETALLTKDSLTYAKALNNLARAKFLEDKTYDALPELNKALRIRQNKEDLEGQNSSFSTLADFYLENDPEKSFFFAQKLLETAEKIKIAEDQTNALRRLISLNPSNYLKNFQRLTAINDSTQSARNKAKNQFAVVRYDVEQKNAENQNLKLKDVENKINIIYLSFGSGILALALIIGFFWNEKRKKNIRHEKEQEKQLEVKNTELKYSKKVHDVVANGIYQVMTKIENQSDFSKEETLDELEFVYEKSRDISYENTDSHDEKFNEKISKLVASFKNDEIKTFTVGNQEETWENVTKSTQTELYQIIRELLVNMKKHSKANNVILKFEKINNLININYADNGIGISDELIFKNGLSNTVSRIENINGKITFETKTEKGLKVNISFPVS